MTNATVTGDLNILGVTTLSSVAPVLVFSLDEPTTASTQLYAGSVEVTPAADGTFSVVLPVTAEMVPATAYVVTLKWVDDGHLREGFPSWKIRVPAGGGAIGDLLDFAPPPNWVWVGPTPPPSPSVNTYWIDTDATPYPSISVWS